MPVGLFLGRHERRGYGREKGAKSQAGGLRVYKGKMCLECVVLLSLKARLN